MVAVVVSIVGSASGGGEDCFSALSVSLSRPYNLDALWWSGGLPNALNADLLALSSYPTTNSLVEDPPSALGLLETRAEFCF